MSRTQKTYLGIIIATICFILCMRVWPFRLVQNPCVNQYQNVVEQAESEYLSAARAESQVLVTQANYFKKIEIEMVVDQACKGDKVYALLLDENKEVVYEEAVSVLKINKKGKLVIKPDCQITSGVLYTIELYLEGNQGSKVSVKLGNTEALGLLEYSLIGVISEDAVTMESFVANYTYLAPCTEMRLAFYYVLILFGGVVAYFVLLWVGKKTWNPFFQTGKKGYWIGKVLLTIGIVGVAIYGTIFSVVWKKFGGYIYDQIIYSLGIWIAAAFFVAMIWKAHFRKNEQEDDITKNHSEKHPVCIVVNYLQVICFGLMFHAAVMYQNAGTMAGQATNLEWIYLLLGFAMLVMQFEKSFLGISNCLKKEGSKKEKIFYLIYGIAVGCMVAILVVKAVKECGPLKKDADAYGLAVLTKWREIVWVVVFFHTIVHLRIRMLKQISIPMVAIWAFFAIWIWTHKYDYTYVYGIPVYFSAFLLQNYSRQDYGRILKNAVNGMIFAFLLNMFYSLLHRPFHRMRFYRYQMYFHTVACTGEFQIAAFAAVLSKLLNQYRKGKLHHAGWEMLLLGVIQSYEVLSMTRTALLTTMGILICGLFAAFLLYQVKVKEIGIRFIAIILAMVVSFPTVYSVTRMIPALVDDPYHFDIFMENDFPDRIDAGAGLDDEKYMDFIRFLYCLTTRFSLPKPIVEWIEDGYRDIFYDPNSCIETMVAGNVLSSGSLQKLSHIYFSEEGKEDLEEDVSNGRFEIWSYYMKDLNFEGHEELYLTLEDGELIVHAHNSFIQMTHSFGYLGGLSFLLLIVAGILKCCIMILRGRKDEKKESYDMYITCFVVLLAYSVASLTEWLSTITIPLALFFWISCICLSRKHEKEIDA